MSDCPSRESLERLLAEMLSDHERPPIEAHVEGCEACQKALHDLTMGASAIRLTSSGKPPAGNPQDAHSEAFFDRLKQIKPPTNAVASGAVDSPDGKAVEPLQIEGYEILGELGRGAAGVVYRARHIKLNRLVALKVILAGSHLSPEMRHRFRLEAQAIARLRHANIVQIYDVGEHNDCPFLSLELVEGGNLAEWMGGKPKSANDAARAISTLAKAVEYAHHQGVVHRDLKPGNVLLSVLSDRPEKRELKITDFGIAKVLPQGGIAEAGVTQTGEILGTPAYMAPEQARGNASEISPATDVYSLGAMLYELLTGRPPFQGATPLDTLMLAARQDPISIYLLAPRVPRDLNTICLKCLEKDPAKRYPSAAELAADLGRFLRKEPIHAKPLSVVGHGIRWMRRHQALAASLAAVVVLIVLLTASLTIATAHFRFLEQQQRALAHEKGELADEKEIQRIRAVTAEQHESQLREQAQKEGAELRQNLYFDQMNLASQASLSPTGIGRVHEWLSAWEEGKPDLRNWEWYFLNGLCHRDRLTLTGHLNGVLSVAWSPDGGRLASGGREGRVRIWDSSSGRETTSFSRFDSDVTTVAWNPQGNRVAAAELNGVVKIWDVNTGSEETVFRGHKGAVFGVAWSPDGKSLASGGDDQTVQIWNATTGNVQAVLRGNKQSVRDVQWSPDGKRVASAGEDWDIHIWNLADGSINHVLHGHINIVNRIAWSPDGNWLASASNDQTIKLWSTNSGAEIKTMVGHTLEVQAIAWSPDGQRLASGASDQTVKIWDPVHGAEIATLRGHTQGVTSVNWAPDSRRLASGSTDQTVKIWDISSPAEVPSLVGHSSNIWTIAWSADGRHLASGSEDQTVRIWDSATNTEQFQLHGHTNQIRAVAFNPDGSRLASAGLDQTIRIWDATNGKQLAVLPGPLAVRALAWSPDGRRLASGGVDHLIHFRDAATGKEAITCRGHDGDINGLAFSPDGQRLASASGDQSVKIWDAASGRTMLTLYGLGGGFFSVAWSPDGQQLAAACNDQTIRIWDSASGQLIRALRAGRLEPGRLSTGFLQRRSKREVVGCTDGRRSHLAQRGGKPREVGRVEPGWMRSGGSGG
jgi:WD40 repeat protein/serine/threonine protein kinase